jgi:general secretion pathway protein G
MVKQSDLRGGRAGRPWAVVRRRAFTLVEVIIVLAIVLLLSGLVGVAVMQRRGEARTDTVKIELNTIRNAMKLFYLDFDRYPTDEEGVAVLWDRNLLEGDEDETRRWKRYLDRPMPTDRWGSPWGYSQVSELGEESEYDLWSWGPDKQDGTDDDIHAFAREADEFGQPLPGGN